MARTLLENLLLRLVASLTTVGLSSASPSSLIQARVTRVPVDDYRSGNGLAEQYRVSGPASVQNFGPGNCVSLSRTSYGTCNLTTNCVSEDTSGTEFSFVCFNPNTSLPYALHSYGRGGFDPVEVFDTGVMCRSCATVVVAYETGGPEVQKALLKILPGDVLAILPSNTKATDSSSVSKDLRRDISYYGPSSCVTTFRAPYGTCIIETRCDKAALANFNVGITCLDKTGSYARYLFGKGRFDAREVFDTRVECDACLGVGADNMETLVASNMPKQWAQDMNSLSKRMDDLSEQLRAGVDKTELSVDFDCAAGVEYWRAGWSTAKKNFCCNSVGTGCPDFNCSAGVEQWTLGWSDMKKSYCCEDSGVGCEVVAEETKVESQETEKVSEEETIESTETGEKMTEAVGASTAAEKLTTTTGETVTTRETLIITTVEAVTTKESLTTTTAEAVTEKDDLSRTTVEAVATTEMPEITTAEATTTTEELTTTIAEAVTTTVPPRTTAPMLAPKGKPTAKQKPAAKTRAPLPAPKLVPAKTKGSLFVVDASIAGVGDTPVIVHHRRTHRADVESSAAA